MADKFKVGDKVKRIDGTKNGGVVKYLACPESTAAGGKTCDKKTCPHIPKEIVFVSWSDGKLTSDNEAAFEIEATTEATPPPEQTLKEKLDNFEAKLDQFKDKEEPFDWGAYNEGTGKYSSGNPLNGKHIYGNKRIGA